MVICFVRSQDECGSAKQLTWSKIHYKHKMLVSVCVCDDVVRVMQPPECQNFDAETNSPFCGLRMCWEVSAFNDGEEVLYYEPIKHKIIQMN